MAEKVTCEYCGKDAIGFQSFEGSFEYVCQDHAHVFLLELKPGEKKLPRFVSSNDTVDPLLFHKKEIFVGI